MRSQRADSGRVFEEIWAKVIIDGFIFYNEVDILHMRLEELYPVVDKFILVQAHHTFRGVPKEKYFDRRDPQWAPYIDKIRDITIGLPGGNNAWERERYQRNVISTELEYNGRYKPDDIVMISDVDEIPHRELIENLPDMMAFEPYKDGVQLEMDMFYYALNVYKGCWSSLKAVPVWKIDTAEAVRHRQYPTITGGGWHFSYLGDDEFISNKLRSFSHTELDTPLVHSKIAENRAKLLDPYNHQEELELLSFRLHRMPHAVRNNPEYWSKYVWSESD